MKITGEGSYTYLITLIRANSLIFKSITGMLTLIWVGGGVILPPPSLFSLNNSKTVKTVTLEFCSIQ